jgi:hypothetical protein
VGVAPGGNGVVQFLQGWDAAHEIDQKTEYNAADERARERERQQEAGGDAAVESPYEQTAKRGVRTDGFADGAGRLQRRANRGDR